MAIGSLLLSILLFRTFCDLKQVVYDLSMARKGLYGGRTLELCVKVRCDSEFSNRGEKQSENKL